MRAAEVEREKKLVRVNEFITVSELAQILKVSPTEIVGFAFKNLGLMITVNQRLDFDQIEIVAGEFGFQAVREDEYQAEEVGTVIALALTDPQQLGLPFGAWTLDRLTAYLHEHQGIAIKRSRIGELLLAEGLRWRSQETWYGERVDPAFAEKRGPSSPSTRPRRRVV